MSGPSGHVCCIDMCPRESVLPDLKSEGPHFYFIFNNKPLFTLRKLLEHQLLLLLFYYYLILKIDLIEFYLCQIAITREYVDYTNN